jgi:hypothetical protein
MNQTWLDRKLTKIERKKNISAAKSNELQQFGMTVHALNFNDAAHWVWT